MRKLLASLWRFVRPAPPVTDRYEHGLLHGFNIGRARGREEANQLVIADRDFYRALARVKLHIDEKECQ